ncbi:MAG: SDR family NAD(P)-dependent oxidoreductase [Woeseiaceae bacterium]
MNLELDGTRALVTGGSRGIGRAIVELLAQEGCSVEFCARSEPRVEATEGELTAAGLAVRGTAVDLAETHAAAEWAAEAVSRLDGLDILVANASAMATGSSDDTWEQNYRVEIASLRELVSIAAPHLKDSAKRRGDAAVVVIGSTAALRADKVDAYGATKAALVHAVKGLSAALIGDGIRANMVSPGPVYSKDGVWDKVRIEDPEVFAEKIAQMPLGRMGTAREVANVVVFLCSPRARYIVGSNVVVDGGRSDRPQY